MCSSHWLFVALGRLDYCNSILAGQTAKSYSASPVGSKCSSTAYLYDSTVRSHHRRAYHWLRVPERILFRIAVLTYWSQNGAAPSYMSSYFTRVADVPSRGRGSGPLSPTDAQYRHYVLLQSALGHFQSPAATYGTDRHSTSPQQHRHSLFRRFLFRHLTYIRHLYWSGPRNNFIIL